MPLTEDERDDPRDWVEQRAGQTRLWFNPRLGLSSQEPPPGVARETRAYWSEHHDDAGDFYIHTYTREAVRRKQLAAARSLSLPPSLSVCGCTYMCVHVYVCVYVFFCLFMWVYADAVAG